MNKPNVYDAHLKVKSVIVGATPETISGTIRYWNNFVLMFNKELVDITPDYYLGGVAKKEYHEIYVELLFLLDRKVADCANSFKFNGFGVNINKL